MLKIEHLTKVFGKGTINEMTALNDVSFHGNAGDFITIIGSNGAGKSTLMNCIAGVFPAETGKITLDGIDITKMPEHKRAKYIGRVFQDPMKGTAFDMTIEENLSIAYNKIRKRGLQAGISKADRELFQEKLSLLGMGLENRMKEKVRLLSGGQRQALTLFMAVIAKPKLLLLDEHTAALDPSAARKVLEQTDYFAKDEKMCTMMITHNMKAALEHGNRTILMQGGQIKMDISGKERDEMTVENSSKNSRSTMTECCCNCEETTSGQAGSKGFLFCPFFFCFFMTFSSDRHGNMVYSYDSMRIDTK